MNIPQTHTIDTGSVIVFIRRKYFVHLAFPLSERLREILSQTDHPASQFATLAEMAVRVYTPHMPPVSSDGMRWNKFFGDQKIPPEPHLHDVFGTIVINTTTEKAFCVQIEQTDSFVPYLLRAFMRREDPAQALAFLGEFAAATCTITKLYPGWRCVKNT